MTMTTGHPQPRQTVEQYRAARATLDTAKAQILANGEVVAIDAPAATAAALEQLQTDWERLRARAVAAQETQGQREKEALEAEFYAGAMDVVAFRTATKQREARTAQAVTQA